MNLRQSYQLTFSTIKWLESPIWLLISIKSVTELEQKWWSYEKWLYNNSLEFCTT